MNIGGLFVTVITAPISTNYDDSSNSSKQMFVQMQYEL